MENYLIEFRFFGKDKFETKKLIYHINRKFKLRKKKAVPHVSLAGGFTTNDESRLIKEFNKFCSNSPIMEFNINGYGTFDENRVVFINIDPSELLKKFRWGMSKQIQPYCKLKPYDYEKDFKFHATLAMKLDPSKFNKVKNYIKYIREPKYKHVLMRVSLIRNRNKQPRILCEYDFLQRKLLDRRQALSRQEYEKTRKLLDLYLNKKYNPDKNLSAKYKNDNNIIDTNIVIENTGIKNSKSHRYTVVPKMSFIGKIRKYFKNSEIFVTSDTHFDHENVIRFCNRPFHNVKQMNKILLENWNNTVGKKDIVYFLGDLVFGKGSHSTEYWLKKLNGNIIFIGGSHDDKEPDKFFSNFYKEEPTIYSKNVILCKNYILEYKGIKFFLTHEPENVPKDWDGWAICGHHHNNRPEEYPFINRKSKRINISVEFTQYKPYSLDKIVELINNHE